MDAFTKKRIEKILENYIEKKIPRHLREEIQIKYKFRADTLTLTQETPGYIPGTRVELPIAQFRLEGNQWKIYWKDSKNRWHFINDIEPDESFETQLLVVDKDEMGIFWL
ncbi:DUF3024 domain-containing protein [Paenibacillus sp.]|jgi:hypothetical protein|uniref:DUF3024 domain-containing protein n=1 Tax=Paenibacillus sp. TaxID=58172 RepID=UPI0028308D62|nr:DUF3024 domain-containing protein [Paenibacillus sp.]MDR0267220.1 DUF3024 domain-containing protein [Paenibacillus sp.]